MSPFIETIRIENGRPLHLSLHQARMEATCSRFFPQAQPLSLHKLLSGAPRSSVGRIKARIVYGADGVVEKSYQPYILRRIERLRLVIDNEIDYAYKSTDRQSLLHLLECRGDCDDILIVRRGLLTDTSFTNIALFDGHRWLTPAQPLLQGTMRHALLSSGLLVEANISASALPSFQYVMLFNAMIDAHEVVLPIGVIDNP